MNLIGWQHNGYACNKTLRSLRYVSIDLYLIRQSGNRVKKGKKISLRLFFGEEYQFVLMRFLNKLKKSLFFNGKKREGHLRIATICIETCRLNFLSNDKLKEEKKAHKFGFATDFSFSRNNNYILTLLLSFSIKNK